ncbi:MAG: pyrroline-5-carboxylate reductase [Pseudomonadota bacterium]
MVSSPTLCLVGAGNMGGAMLGGWLAAGRDPGAIMVIDPKPPEPMADMIAEHGVRWVRDAKDAGRADIVLVAVKPNIIGQVLPTLTPVVDGDTVLVSVAAGIPIERLAEPFGLFDGAPAKVVRSMPNTPAMVQRGITVCVANSGVSDAQREDVTTLLEAIGAVEWVDDEGLIDAVTGVSGSGPAYVFHLVEALAEAGKTAGLPNALAERLALETVSGAGELLRQSDLPPSQLRINVTSPNGTTAAALEVLMGEGGFPELLEKAVAAATNRSRELAKS